MITKRIVTIIGKPRLRKLRRRTWQCWSMNAVGYGYTAEQAYHSWVHKTKAAKLVSYNAMLDDAIKKGYMICA